MGEQFLLIGMVLLGLGIVVVWLSRFFLEMGAIYPKGRIRSWCQGKWEHQGEPFKLKTAGKVFGAALLIRLAVYLAGIVICTQFVEYYRQSGVFDFEAFLQSWKRWDAVHYINLAQMGYDDYIENGQHLFLVFFPLYPWVLRIFYPFLQNWEMTGLCVSTLAFCVGSVFFYGVILEEYGKELAKWSFLLLSFYPFSFFFGGIMSESLFFCLLSAGFFFIRRHNWLAAGLVGAFCSMCRIQGILLLGVGFVEFFVTYRPLECLRQNRLKQFFNVFFKKGSFLFLTLIGSLIYLAINKSVEGEWFRFQVYQREHWYHTTTFAANCFNEIINNMIGQGTDAGMRIYVWLPEFFIFVVALLLLVYSIRRHPLRYSAFLFVYTLINYSVTFLISGCRYMACALPVFLFLAEWTAKRKVLNYIILFIFICLFLFYFHGFMSGQQVV